jgi:predicted deacylase
MGEYAAYKVIKDIEGADFCLDVHGSDMYLCEIPQIRMNDDVEQLIMPYVEHLNTDMIWVHPSTQVKKGSLAYELNKIGVKCCVCESSYAFKIDQKYCNQIVDGIFALMKYMGIWKGKIAQIRDPFVVHDSDMVYINSESSGIFIPNTSVHDIVKENDEIGRVVNVITGSVDEIIKAPINGMITGMREYPAIEEGSLLARIVGLK